jgi:GNAT superfamily N-acetyltransferase
MAWRVPSLGNHWDTHKGKLNRAAFRQLIESGRAKGCLAFHRSKPIGWCSVGPREDFPYLSRSRLIPKAYPTGTWSLTCFYILPQWRRHQVSGLLIRHAIVTATDAGAMWLEGYPSHPSKGITMAPAFAHTGLLTAFLREGFKVTAWAGARAVVRKGELGCKKPFESKNMEAP